MDEREGCPSEDLFVQFLSGKLTREEVTRLEHHAASCSTCLDLISGAAPFVTPPLHETVELPAGGVRPRASTGPTEHRRAPVNALCFGPFQVVGVLGRGGMGIVYRAVDERDGREVAVKTLRPSRRGALVSLRREIHALSRIHHPGVVRILAQGQCDGEVEGEETLGWYAMELVEGSTLSERLATTRWRQPRLDRSQTEERTTLLNVLRRLCSTLGVLHAAGFVHRDLSPRNIIVRADGTPVLVDFGFSLADAAVTGEREVLQLDTMQAGTLLYMAPEQILGEACDARSDLYSLGCILYEALTGHPPFISKDPKYIIDAHLSTPPRPPCQLVPGLARGMEDLVLWLLAKHPRERPAYADQVAQALDRVLGAPEVPAPSSESTGYLYRSKLVGRQSSLTELEALLDRCERGQGGRVFITGESGSGKTRLATELASRAYRLGMEVVLGTSTAPTPLLAGAPHSAAAALQPLKPFLAAVAEYCRSQGKQESLRVLGPRGRLLAGYELALQEAPGLSELPKPSPLAGEGARFRLFDALEHTLAAFASRRPTVLILDDLQWADELTLSFVCEHLRPEFFARHPVLIAATCREEGIPKEVHRCLLDDPAKHLALPPLDSVAMARMVSEMLGNEPAPKPLTIAVATHAFGNPLFVVEYLRTALSEQHLVRKQGAWRLESSPSLPERSLSTPLPVRELVLRRFSRLSRRAQRLVDLAAVLGREFDVDLLLETAQAALQDPGADEPPTPTGPEENLGALADLVARQVLEIADSGQYRFVHDKLREIAYERIPVSSRPFHHALAAGVIERRRTHERDFGRHYTALAAHYGAAHDDQRAVYYLHRAARRALGAGAARETQAHCTRALELVASGRVPFGTARRVKLYRLRAEAHFALAELPACRADALAVIKKVCGSAPSSGGQWSQLLALHAAHLLLHRLLPTRWWMSRGRSRVFCTEASVVAGLLSQVCYFNNDWLPMAASLVLGANLAERAGAPAEIISAFARLGYIAGLTPLKGLAEVFFRSASGMARLQGDLSAQALTLYLRAFHDLGEGQFGQAEQAGQQAVRLLDQVGDAQGRDTAETIVGHALYFQGRFEESCTCYSALLESARRRANQQHIGWALTLQARSLLALGRANEAVPLLEQAHPLLAPLADRLSIVMCEGLLATTYLATDRFLDAQTVAAGLETRLRGSILPLLPCLHGYVGAAAVALASWKGSTDDPARRQARIAARRLWRFARRFRMARPFALAVRAAVATRGGRPRQATRWDRKAIQEARAVGLSAQTLSKI